MSLQLLAQAKVAGTRHMTLSLLLAAEAARLNPTEAWSSLVRGVRGNTWSREGLRRSWRYRRPKRRSTAVDVGTDVFASVTQQKANRPVVQLWDLSTGSQDGKLVERFADGLAARDAAGNNLYGLSVTELASGPRRELAARYVCVKRLCATRAPAAYSSGTCPRMRVTSFPASEGFSALTFSHAGSRLAAADAHGVVQVWDVSTRRRLSMNGRARSPGGRRTWPSLRTTRCSPWGGGSRGSIVSWTVSGISLSNPTTIAFPPGRFPAQVVFGTRASLGRPRQQRQGATLGRRQR